MYTAKSGSVLVRVLSTVTPCFLKYYNICPVTERISMYSNKTIRHSIKALSYITDMLYDLVFVQLKWMTHLHSCWRNAQIWLAISLGSKSLKPQVWFLDPMLSGNEKHLHNTYCLFAEYLLSLYLQWNSPLHCFSNIFMGNRFRKIPACLN